ncbi:serine hydrolase domain-containing protein [Rhizobium glycinendophyticum]|uniref:Serine hydrolase n=1 Tax=Rhizobium glycinendophyticum TaxID=2589807 RepID=A0A504U8H2_9HYPH|nr:serine hydrolase [Rhizobium glycinendophyticum]TPP11478.1 serine hydrolase [Rhizobium glycinendophyticum]
MRLLSKLLVAAGAALVILVLGGCVWLWLAPPDLLRVGTGYAAKIVCSNVFLAGRDADDVLTDDVQAPGHPLLRLVGVDVDLDRRLVTADLAGFIAPSVAVYRDGLGCASVPDGDIASAQGVSAPVSEAVPSDDTVSWPEGERVGAMDSRLSTTLQDAALLGSAYRAVVVVKDGRIVGESYGAGFNAQTPLLGWSMAKSVNAVLAGKVAADQGVDLDTEGLFPEWTGDRRAKIRLSDLLAMQSGLDFNEDYGAVTDVTRMLYLQSDMAAYARSVPAIVERGTRFNYSSGEAVLISKWWMSRFSDPKQALAYPRKALFDPIGMRSAVLEADAHGTLVGSSYLYATARDWARFGLLLAQGGVWDGKPIVPADFVTRMTTPTAASGGVYGGAQAWRKGPGDEADAHYGLPADVLWLLGHDGQSVAVIPSENLVVVRMGLTPSRGGYRPQRLVAAIRDALKR